MTPYRPFSRLAAVRPLRLALSVLCSTLALGAALPSLAAARVPQGFVGVMMSGPMLYSGTNLTAQMNKMVASGVETLRVVFSWADGQPYQSWSDVPPAKASQFEGSGVPTNFQTTDKIVRLAAQHGLRVLPVVVYTPSWDAAKSNTAYVPQPRRVGPYADFLTLLVRRYGPTGRFWSTHRSIPRVPIRQWQIWNEPNGTYYWASQPFARSYVALLAAAHTAIKRADRSAQVVLGGLSNYSWQYLDQIYRVRGARSAFDVAAIHPYTAQPQGIITVLRRVRAVMNHYGDRRKPLMATELGWPDFAGQTSGPDFLATTPSAQANKFASLYPLLLKNRARLGLAGFDYYTWADNETHGGYYFDFAGLFRVHNGVFYAKPVYNVFRRVALTSEGCRVKGSTAFRCAKR
jgi:polysaccharide biosynthesis protein PslG